MWTKLADLVWAGIAVFAVVSIEVSILTSAILLALTLGWVVVP